MNVGSLLEELTRMVMYDEAAASKEVLIEGSDGYTPNANFVLREIDCVIICQSDGDIARHYPQYVEEAA